MAQIQITIGSGSSASYKLNIKASLSCMLDVSLYHDDNYTKTNDSTSVLVNTSNIPAGATINSVKLNRSTSVKHEGSSSSYYLNTLISGTSSAASNDNIKKWLIDNKKSDGSYPNFKLYFGAGITTITHSTTTVGTQQFFDTKKTITITNLSLTVDYTPAYNPQEPSPKIANFYVKDLSKTKEEFQYLFSQGTDEYLGGTKKENLDVEISASHSPDPSHNCIYMNRANLLFFAEAAVGENQLVKTITYDLTITANDENKTIIYSSVGNSKPDFSISSNVFSLLFNLTGASVSTSDSIKCWPCHFSYVAYDVGNNGTQVKGTFYFLEDYTQPIVNTFLINRIAYELNDSGVYTKIVSSEGSWLETTLEINTSKAPLCIENEELLSFSVKTFNPWSFIIKYQFEQNESTVVDKSYSQDAEKTIKIDQDVELISGEYIEGSPPKHKNPFDSSNSYTFSLIVNDIISISTTTIEVLPAFSYFNIELTGISIGTREQSGSEEEPHFDVKLPSYYYNSVVTKGAIAAEGTVLLTQGVTYGTAAPEDVFTGEEGALPEPVAGQIYFKLI